MSWQEFKSIGEKLHADLAAKHKPSEVRSILKVLGGENVRNAICGDGGRPRQGLSIAEEISERLMDLEPKQARIILTLIDAMLTRQAMGKHAAEVDKLYEELRGEFETGPIRMILEAAERAGKRAGKIDPTLNR